MKKSEKLRQLKNYRISNEQTEVKLKRVKISYNLGFISSSEFESMFYEFWKAINGGNDRDLRGIKEQLRSLKNLITSSLDLYMVSFDNSIFGKQVFLINKEYLLDITSSWIVAELGDQIHSVQPPYEDFIDEFIEEVLLLMTTSVQIN